MSRIHSCLPNSNQDTAVSVVETCFDRKKVRPMWRGVAITSSSPSASLSVKTLRNEGCFSASEKRGSALNKIWQPSSAASAMIKPSCTSSSGRTPLRLNEIPICTTIQYPAGGKSTGLKPHSSKQVRARVAAKICSGFPASESFASSSSIVGVTMDSAAFHRAWMVASASITSASSVARSRRTFVSTAIHRGRSVATLANQIHGDTWQALAF